jgi:hypothetical protein
MSLVLEEAGDLALLALLFAADDLHEVTDLEAFIRAPPARGR